MDWLIVIAGYFAAALACSALWFAAACIRLFFKERRHRLCRCACGCTRMDSPPSSQLSTKATDTKPNGVSR